MMCTHKLVGGPLVCDNTQPHDPDARGGHTYSASDAPDRHDETEK